MPSFIERILLRGEEEQKKRQEALKTNPRYDIDRITNKEGMVPLFFNDPEAVTRYKRGDSVIASTERFLPTDIRWHVPNERIEKITDGRTLAHLQALSSPPLHPHQVNLIK